jgi:hypothetical protein
MLLAALLCLAPAAGAAAPTRPNVTTSTIAPGIQLIRIIRKRPPNRIKVLRVDVRRAPSIDIALAGAKGFGFRRTSRIAAGHGAVAAVNGTFTLGTGRPYSIFARNGDLKASPLLWSRAFSLAADEREFFMGHPRLRVAARSSLPSEVLDIARFNEAHLDRGELVAHSPVGGRFYRPPGYACSARLGGVGEIQRGSTEAMTTRPYVVRWVRCSRERLARRGGLVLSARRGTEQAAAIRALRPYEPLSIGWSVGWPGALDIMGGNPPLISDGHVVAPWSCGSHFCNRNPRTGIGMTADGDVLLATVDGRRPRWSVGMTLAGFARVFESLGAIEALNLDGGGSTTMVVRGRVLNRPSDARGERPVGSAILVHRADDVEREPAAGWTPSERAASVALATDAASTGGMLDAAARGVLGPRPRDLPGGLFGIVRTFRSRPPAPR